VAVADTGAEHESMLQFMGEEAAVFVVGTMSMGYVHRLQQIETFRAQFVRRGHRQRQRGSTRSGFDMGMEHTHTQ
jgi:hypothetical protein